jgi:hypothetical protein
MLGPMRSLPVRFSALLFCAGCATRPDDDPAEILTRLESISFGGEGRVEIVDDTVTLGMGSPLTGVRWVGPPLPTVDYEVEVLATRVLGGDFFCGMTFPVADSHCTLIVGGWGGALVGLSCIDGADAADNEVTTHRSFTNGRAYRVRVRVTRAQIRVWIDDEPVIDADVAGRRLSLRGDVAQTAPFAVCSYSTVARLRDLRIRRL